jgi:hypothetical protein
MHSKYYVSRNTTSLGFTLIMYVLQLNSQQTSERCGRKIKLVRQAPVRAVLPGHTMCQIHSLPRSNTIAQDYRDFGLCPSSGILKNTKHTHRFGNWICFRPQVRAWETPTLLGPIERVILNQNYPVTEVGSF